MSQIAGHYFQSHLRRQHFFTGTNFAEEGRGRLLLSSCPSTLLVLSSFKSIALDDYSFLAAAALKMPVDC